MCLRWGKNVKKTVKSGTGGVPIPPIRKKVAGSDANVTPLSKLSSSMSNNNGSPTGTGTDSTAIITNGIDIQQKTIEINEHPTNTKPSSMIIHNKNTEKAVVEYNEATHAATAIRVITPTNKKRLQFITTVASFVAKDGSVLEKRLLERESNNPLFSFLQTQPQPQILSTTDSKKHNANMNEQILHRWRVYAFSIHPG